MKLYTVSILLFWILFAQGQYNPPAGQIGSSAIHKDSALIKDWATACQVNRGWKNILDTTLGKTTVGNTFSATGKAGLNGVLSLGDAGEAILSFAGEIYNGPGPDFVVFENAFDAYFLELAFVEVSSDGQNFFRFPAHSMTDTITQVGTFGTLDASKLNNLAGKYEQSFGVPFDLEELRNTPGLDINHISHVRVIDVVGGLNNAIASRDSAGRKVNDPFPTPFPSGGFDLDGVGVIHLRPTGVIENHIRTLTFYPNPTKGVIYLPQELQGGDLTLLDLNGREVLRTKINKQELDISQQADGLYFIHIVHQSISIVERILKE